MSSPSVAIHKTKSPVRWLMLIFMCLFTFTITGFTNQSFNLLLVTIMGDMGWTAAQLTMITTAFTSGLMFFVFIAGIVLDRFSAKKLLVVTIIVIGALVLLRAFAQNFPFFYALMLVFGVANAFFLPASVKVIGLWFGEDELFFANGCLQASSPLGMLVANLFLTQIMSALFGSQWQNLFLTLGIVLFVLGILFFIFGKERKNEDAALSSSSLGAEDLGLWKNIRGVIRVPRVWVYILANVFFMGTLFAAMGVGQFIFQSDPGWGGYYGATAGLSMAQSGQISASSNIMSMSALALVPLIMRKIGQKHFVKIVVIAGVLNAVLNLIGHASYIFPLIIATMVVSGFLCGFCIPAPRILMLRLPEVSGPRAGTAMGLFITAERVCVTFFVGLLTTLITVPGARMSVILGVFYLLQLGSPLLILLGAHLTKRADAKAAAAQVSTEA